MSNAHAIEDVLAMAGLHDVESLIKELRGTEMFCEARMIPAFLRAYVMMFELSVALVAAAVPQEQRPQAYAPWLVKDDTLTVIGLDASFVGGTTTVAIFTDTPDGAFFLWVPSGRGNSHEEAVQTLGPIILEMANKIHEEFLMSQKGAADERPIIITPGSNIKQ